MKRWAMLGVVLGVGLFSCGETVFADGAAGSGKIVKATMAQKPGIPKDVPAGHWAREAVDKLIARGVIKLGPDARFNGKKAMSRYEMASLLAKALEGIESGGSKATAEDLALVKKLSMELSSEVEVLKQAHAEQDAAMKASIRSFEERLEAVEKKYEARLAGVEKARSPVVFNGDWRYRYQHSQVADNANGKGSTTTNASRVRLGGKVSIDESTFGYFRFRVDQQIRRNADADGTAVTTDYLYLDKKGLLGGDWRFGRQYDTVGNGMLFINFFDGIKYTRSLGDKFDFLGMAVSQTTNTGVATRSHGLNTNLASVIYKPNASHTIQLSHFRQNAERDKFGVIGLQTWEQWLSADLKGSFGCDWKYFGTAAAYRNSLDEGNTVAAQRHLRGDIDNTGYMFGVTYDRPQKYSLGTLWAEHLDNFRAIDVLPDVFYLGIPSSPLEDVFNALAVTAANARTGRNETILPVNAAAAAPFASPIGRVGDNRPAALQDIHGYRDLQVNGKYHFRDDLALLLNYNVLTPARSGYNYADVKSLTARLRYAYNAKTNIELRGIHATSDYGRRVNDIRTEFYMKY
ncbi:MAG TPA: S-layer homology domain-containing protein [Candidatus Ozemobacteraceae bacterium]